MCMLHVRKVYVQQRAVAEGEGGGVGGVLYSRGGKQGGLLRDEADVHAQQAQVVVPDVLAVDGDAPRLGS